MTPRIQRAELPPHVAEDAFAHRPTVESGTPTARSSWASTRSSGASRKPNGRASRPAARAVLGSALVVLAILWMAYTAWSAGRVLADQPLSSPAIAQWVAIAAGPLALLGLAWIMFGRTRRREAERFTRSVIAMRAETQSLEALLEVLSQRIEDSQASLTGMTERLMRLGDETTGRFDGITRELDSSHRPPEPKRRGARSRGRIGAQRHRRAARRFAAAEATTRAIAEHLRGIGSDSAARTAELGQQVGALGERTREADELVAAAAQRLVTHLTQIESAGAAAAARGRRSANPPSRWRSTPCSTAPRRRSTRSAAASTPRRRPSSALVEQASAGIGRAGVEAADVLGAKIGQAGASLDGLSARVAEQERVSQRMFAEIDRGLTADRRALRRARRRTATSAPIISSDRCPAPAPSSTRSPSRPARRTIVDRGAGDAHRGAPRRASTSSPPRSAKACRARSAMPRAAPSGCSRWPRPPSRKSAGCAMRRSRRASRFRASGAGIAEQQDRFAALLALIDDGVGTSETQLAALTVGAHRSPGRSLAPDRRDRPGAGRRAGPGPRGRRAMPPSARARRSRASFRRAPASCRKRPARRSKRRSAKASRTACARSRRLPRARSKAPARRRDRLTQQMLTPRPEQRRARAIFRAEARPTSARRTAKPSPAACRC